jgi:WD40 repeat protein
VNSAAFSSDGARVVTASDDKTARIWDARTGRAIVTLEGHSASVWSAAFSSDGARVVTASEDNTAIIHPATIGPWLRDACHVLATIHEVDTVTAADLAAVKHSCRKHANVP